MDLLQFPAERDTPTSLSPPAKKTRRQARWLTAYAIYGTVREASRVAKVDRSRVYAWEATDEVFRGLKRQAEQDHKEAVVEEIRRRGMEGYDEVMIEEVDGKQKRRRSIHRVSEALLIKYAEARVPELFDRPAVAKPSSVTVHQTNNLVVPIERLSEADFEALERIYGAAGPVLMVEDRSKQAEKCDVLTVRTPDDPGGSEGQA